MHLTALKTTLVTPKSPLKNIQNTSLEEFLDENLVTLKERSILVVTSKVISLIEGRILPLTEDKEVLLQKHADYYLPPEYRRHGTCTITHHAFIGGAGIDESNAAGHFVLLPTDSQVSARLIQTYLQKRFQLSEVGVIITDSHSTPMRRGASGIALAYAGFVGLKDYRGTPDLFGRPLKMELANIPDALAAAAVLLMGEGDEQTPLVIIEELDHITFDTLAPTEEELSTFFVPLEEDIFAPIFDMTKLTKGKGEK